MVADQDRTLHRAGRNHVSLYQCGGSEQDQGNADRPFRHKAARPRSASGRENRAYMFKEPHIMVIRNDGQLCSAPVFPDCHNGKAALRIKYVMPTKIALQALGVFLFAELAFGQSQIGGATLNGTVSDASAAVVAGAKVTATQVETG